MGRKFRILSIDGGGLRGVIPIKILKAIELATGKRISDMFDLIAGTSTGGLIACGLSVADDASRPRFTLEEIEEIYLEKGKVIFPKPAPALSIFKRMSSLFRPEFSSKGLDNVLNSLFNNLDGTQFKHARMVNCSIPVLVTSYDIIKNRPVVFKTRKAMGNLHYNPSLYDICRATTAAPTYLPAYSFVYGNDLVTCIDGGVVANNPSMLALEEVRKNNYHYAGSKIEDREIYLLSLGTGYVEPKQISRSAAHLGGKIKWAPTVIDIALHWPNQFVDYMVSQSLTFEGKSNYLRLNVDLHNRDLSEMANSSPSARKYLLERLEALAHNATLVERAAKFLKEAGII